MDLLAETYVGVTFNHALRVLFYGFVGLSKVIHCGWICRPRFMDLWILDYTLQAHGYMSLNLNYVLRAMALFYRFAGLVL